MYISLKHDQKVTHSYEIRLFASWESVSHSLKGLEQALTAPSGPQLPYSSWPAQLWNVLIILHCHPYYFITLLALKIFIFLILVIAFWVSHPLKPKGSGTFTRSSWFQSGLALLKAAREGLKQNICLIEGQMQASKAGKQRSRNRVCWIQQGGADSTKDSFRRLHICGFLLLHTATSLFPYGTRSLGQGEGRRGREGRI